MADGKSLTIGRLHQDLQETSTEADARRAGNFSDVEEKLPQLWSADEVGRIETATAVLGLSKVFGKSANPNDHKVWVLDNTAFRPMRPQTHDPQPWQAEFVACFFHTGRKDIGEFVSKIADQIGLDGRVGADLEAKKRIEERVQPLVDAIAPATYTDVSLSSTTGQPHIHRLGPSNANGISSQIVVTGDGNVIDGTVIKTTSANNLFPNLSAHTRFASPDGWAIISDIDDTIKVTHTTDPIGALKTTFAEIPKTTEGLPEFYQVLHEQFKNPAWFYLSASPYNLYPFIHTFIRDYYKPGTIILRDSSWMVLGGFLKSLTQGTQAYKTDRMKKIHEWLPHRKFICVGDSTQSDPEAYAEMFHKYKNWVKAIYIRVVENEPHMTEKNKPERFEKAFKGVPREVWRLFTDPRKDLAEHVKNVADEANLDVTGALQDYLCSSEQNIKADQRITSANIDSGNKTAFPESQE